MPRFQRYGFPYQFYRPYNFRPYAPAPPPPSPNPIHNEHQNVSTSNKHSNSKSDTVMFDLFGIKLYFDDVLILSLLFFLYKEEVKDEGLFLALVLLLIS